jgi:hypothetical protein
MNATIRFLTCVIATAIISLSASMAQAQAPLSVSPGTVEAGGSPTLTVSSSGFFNLSKVNASQIAITPDKDISNIQVSKATPRRLTLSFDAGNFSTGDHTLTINANDVAVSVKFSIAAKPDRNACTPACRLPTPDCVGGRCLRPVRCEPKCPSDKRCVRVGASDAGRCAFGPER